MALSSSPQTTDPTTAGEGKVGKACNRKTMLHAVYSESHVACGVWHGHARVATCHTQHVAYMIQGGVVYSIQQRVVCGI